ncbi:MULTISPECIES: hypothetical protein [unclassified Pseudofrankia]|uniref:hypothetical protein n=1 Tax=unclassified Pseudofrankia TaxID=2994372 RepID=UPI0008DAB0DE|nr:MULTISPECIES: hypothetical protein [unclassified Pseudofrankia]MDT3440118.1 hypothetical protein [Pseudofrankia sp. BMG5.37]OHV44726.1 hypothetical protein BCD48_24935 [Pseudofrankia sp. BMG5.36]
MAMHHGADSGRIGRQNSSTGGVPRRRGHPRASGRTGQGATRAVRGLMVSALVAGPLAVLTALPARADGADSSLFDRPVDMQIDIDSSADQPPTFDLDTLGRVAEGIVGDLLPAPGTASGSDAASGSGTASGGGTGAGTGTGSSGRAPAPAGPAPGTPADSDPASAGPDGGPAAPLEANLDGEGQADPAASTSTADGASAHASPVDVSPTAANQAVAASTPGTGTSAATGGNGELVVSHGSLLSSSDSAAIVALDVLAVLLAGAGLVGIPASALLTRRRVSR